MPLKYETVIFDMDGTLIDSDAGVLGSMRYALDTMGLPLPPQAEWRKFLGPPLRFSFKTVAGVDDSQLDEAVRIYREYYRKHGVFQVELYPGMEQLLRDLHQAGAKVCLATSKVAAMAERILENLKLTDLFTYAVGSDEKETDSSKTAKIARVLAHTGTPAERAVMIGDTKFDAEGARGNDMPFIGVLFGYGSRQEMEAVGLRRAVFVDDTAGLSRELLG